MVNFGLLAAEIVSLVWGTPANFNGFRVLTALLHSTLVVGVSQAAAFNRGRHLYSAGRPSGWALAHISSNVINHYCHGHKSQSAYTAQNSAKLEMWANVMATLPNTGGALCSTPQFGCAVTLPRRETR